MWRRKRQGASLLELLVAIVVASIGTLLMIRVLMAVFGLSNYTTVNTGLQQQELIWWQRLSRDLNGSSHASLAINPGGSNCQCLCMQSLAPSTFLGSVRYQNSLTSYVFDRVSGTLTRRQHPAPIPNLTLSPDHPLRVDLGLFPNLEGVITQPVRVASHMTSFQVEIKERRLVLVNASFSDVVPGRPQPCELKSSKILRLDNP